MSTADTLRAAVSGNNHNIKEAKGKEVKENLANPSTPPIGAVRFQDGYPEPLQESQQGYISERLDKGERTLEFFRRGDSGRIIGLIGHSLVFNIERILIDLRAIVELVNDDNVIRDVVDHSFDLLRAAATGKGQGPKIPVPALIENWRTIVALLFTSADVLDMFSTGGSIVHTLRQGDEFLVKLAEARSLMTELLLSVPSQAEGKMSAAEEHKWAGLRSKTIEDLRATWVGLSKNRVWRSLHRKRQPNQSDESVTNIFMLIFDFLQHEFTQVWIDDVCELLQHVVGDKANIDDALEAMFIFLESLGQNNQVLLLVYEIKETFERLTHELAYMNPQQIDSQLLHFAITTQRIKDEIKLDPTSARAFSECTKILDALKSEPTTAQLMKNTTKLLSELRSKNPSDFIDADLTATLRHMILPIILEHLNTLKLPPIKANSEYMGKMEYTLDNLHVDVTSVMPSNIHIRFECSMEHGATRYQAQRTVVYIEVRDIKIHLHNVEWSYARHTFPRFSDKGKVDINSTGDGMILRMKLELKEGLTHSRVIEPLAVRCYMDSIKLKFTKSGHNRLYNFMTGMFSTRIKREIQKNFEQKILLMTSGFNELVASLVAHIKAEPNSSFLRRSSLIRRQSISRRPSLIPPVLPSNPLTTPLAGTPPSFTSSIPYKLPAPVVVAPPSIAPSMPTGPYLSSSAELLRPGSFPVRRGTPMPPTPPIRSTYPPIDHPPSPPLVVASPLRKSTGCMDPAALTEFFPPFSAARPSIDINIDIPANNHKGVRFQTEYSSSAPRDSISCQKDEAEKPLVSILKKQTTMMAQEMPYEAAPISTSYPTKPTHGNKHHGSIFSDLDLAVYRYMHTRK